MNQKLLQILNQLNESKILYGLGGSMMLKMRSFEIEPHDIDLFVCIDEYAQTIEIFKENAVQQMTTSKSPFKTKHFTSFHVEDISIDIMAGFAYEHLEGTYTAVFDQNSVNDLILINSTKIPLMSLEEWYVLYSVMNRSDKIEMIENRWKIDGIDHPFLLQRQQNLELPYSIKQKIMIYMHNKGSLDK